MVSVEEGEIEESIKGMGWKHEWRREEEGMRKGERRGREGELLLSSLRPMEYGCRQPREWIDSMNEGRAVDVFKRSESRSFDVRSKGSFTGARGEASSYFLFKKWKRKIVVYPTFYSFF